MTKTNVFSTAALLLIGFVSGYVFGNQGNEAVLPKQENNTAGTIQSMPECFMGRCPEYVSMDVDGDDLSESIVIIPTAMTQGAGKVWIIDEGRVVFESEEMMRIDVTQTREQQEQGNGFTLRYGTEVNSTESII